MDARKFARDASSDGFGLGRPSSKREPSAPPLRRWEDNNESPRIFGSPSQRRSSEYQWGQPRPSDLKETADMVQYLAAYAMESARRRAELPLESVPSSSIGKGEKKSSAYEVACGMRRREFELGPNNELVRIIETDLNFCVTLVEQPKQKSDAAAAAAASHRSTFSSTSSGETSRLVTATCPFCCRKDEFERKFLNGTVTCDRCLRNFLLED